MTIFRTTLAMLIGASIGQLVPAGTQFASHLETASFHGNGAPVDEQMCEFDRYVAFHHPSTSVRFNSAPRVLAPVPCSDPLAASNGEPW